MNVFSLEYAPCAGIVCKHLTLNRPPHFLPPLDIFHALWFFVCILSILILT